MPQPLWDDEMKFELFRFRSELKVENIRVLAEPLGLGLVQREETPTRSLYPQLAQKPIEMPHVASPLQRSKPIIASPSLPPSAEMPSQALRGAIPSKDLKSEVSDQQPLRASSAQVSRRLFAKVVTHMLDLAFVGLCLVMGLVVLGVIMDPQSMALDASALSQAPPIQLLRQIHPLALIIGIYLVFACYWLFFKIVSGTTLGESCLHNFSHGGQALGAPTDKGSVDP